MPQNKLLTKEVLAKLPPLYSQEHTKDPLVVVKYFTPWTNWTWYGIEFDGEDLFFGYVVGHEKEIGYFSLAELQSITGPAGMHIERDLHFDPTPLSEVRKMEHDEQAAMESDVLLSAIACQVGVGCLASSKSKLPVCSGKRKIKREELIQELKKRNIDNGCKRAEGNGSKKCPNVFAVATAALHCRVGKVK